MAFVTLRSGFDVVSEDLIEHCRQSLARYKVPREVYIEEMLPKNAVGKIDIAGAAPAHSRCQPVTERSSRTS